MCCGDSPGLPTRRTAASTTSMAPFGTVCFTSVPVPAAAGSPASTARTSPPAAASPISSGPRGARRQLASRQPLLRARRGCSAPARSGSRRASRARSGRRRGRSRRPARRSTRAAPSAGARGSCRKPDGAVEPDRRRPRRRRRRRASPACRACPMPARPGRPGVPASTSKLPTAARGRRPGPHQQPAQHRDPRAVDLAPGDPPPLPSGSRSATVAGGGHVPGCRARA